MLDTVKPTATTVWIVPAGTIRCTSVDPEEADAQYLRTGFGATETMYLNVRPNIRLEIDRVVLKEVNYTFTIFFPRHMCFTKLFVIYVYSNH